LTKETPAGITFIEEKPVDPEDIKASARDLLLRLSLEPKKSIEKIFGL